MTNTEQCWPKVICRPRAGDPDVNLHGRGHAGFEKGVKNTHGKANGLSAKGAGKTEYTHSKNEIRATFCLAQKNQFKMDQRP